MTNNVKYELGKEIEWCGKCYTVANLYQLTDEEMATRGLAHRNRVTLTAVDGSVTHDWAVT